MGTTEKSDVHERKLIEMQLIVPVEDPGSGRSTCSNYCIRQQQQQREAGNLTATDAIGTNANNHNSILSDDLRDQFETMKSIWRQAQRENDDDDGSSSNTTMIRKDLKRKEQSEYSVIENNEEEDISE